MSSAPGHAREVRQRLREAFCLVFPVQAGGKDEQVGLSVRPDQFVAAEFSRKIHVQSGAHLAHLFPVRPVAHDFKLQSVNLRAGPGKRLGQDVQVFFPGNPIVLNISKSRAFFRLS